MENTLFFPIMFIIAVVGNRGINVLRHDLQICQSREFLCKGGGGLGPSTPPHINTLWDGTLWADASPICVVLCLSTSFWRWVVQTELPHEGAVLWFVIGRGERVGACLLFHYIKRISNLVSVCRLACIRKLFHLWTLGVVAHANMS